MRYVEDMEWDDVYEFIDGMPVNEEIYEGIIDIMVKKMGKDKVLEKIK